MKADFLFAGYVNIIIQKKSVRKRHILWMKVYKQAALNIQMLRPGCCFPTYPHFWLRACKQLVASCVRCMYCRLNVWSRFITSIDHF